MEKNHSKPGRPPEGRVKLTIHVLPSTQERIASLVDRTKLAKNTLGKVIDAKFKGRK